MDLENVGQKGKRRWRVAALWVVPLVLGLVVLVLFQSGILTWRRYAKIDRVDETIANLAAISTFEEAYFKEHQSYISAAPNPSQMPGNARKQLRFEAALRGWAELRKQGQVIPGTQSLHAQYEVRAGRFDVHGAAVIGGPGSWVSPTEPVRPGGGACSNGNLYLSARSLGVSFKAGSNWFYVTAVRDEDGDGVCQALVKWVGRPDLIILGDNPHK